MSSFSGLNTAYLGLVAARTGMDVVGQNIGNMATEGYTRQRANASSMSPLGTVGRFTSDMTVGQGVLVSSISRLGNGQLDSQVRSTAGLAGYTSFRAGALSALETSLHEPSDAGISRKLDAFWSSWSTLANAPDDAAAGGLLLQSAASLTSAIASGYRAVEAQWSTTREQLDGLAENVNGLAVQVADLNARIRQGLSSGASVNELLDKRSTMLTQLSAMTGAVVTEQPNGTVDVKLDGNALVSGSEARSITVTGALQLSDAAVTPVRIEWSHHPGVAIVLGTGELKGAASLLVAANGTGTGGALAESAEAYNAVATQLAALVNGTHQSGATTAGVTGLDFFALDYSQPAAVGLSVVPTTVDGIAAGSSGAGAYDGSIADAIAQLALVDGGVDDLWAGFVTATGSLSASEASHADMAELAASSAVMSLMSQAGVDIDEENVNLLTYQTAYQGAARMMTAVDEALDVLINRMGLVGR